MSTSRSILFDLRFWLGLFFVIQLFFITQPPVESSHTWRQCFTNMVSRNLAEGEGTIWKPQVDHDGSKSGIVGMEFPIFNVLISFFYSFFGSAHWYGRLINLVVSVFGVYAFSKVIARLSDERTGFYAGIFLLFSIWMIFMRKIMPDTFSVSLVLIAIWMGMLYYHKGSPVYWLIYFVLLTLGLLAKLPAALILAPFGLTVFFSTYSIQRRVFVAIGAVIATSIASLWYFEWVPHLVEQYKYQLYFPRHTAVGFYELTNRKALIANQFIFHSFYAYSAFAVFLFGVIMAAQNGQKRLLYPLLIATPIFFFFMLKTGDVFPFHNYYMIPFVPVMAVYAGYGIKSIRRPMVGMVVLGICCVETVANTHHDLRTKEGWMVELESKINGISDDSDLVVCNGGKGPQLMYFLNRRGWTLIPEFITSDKLEECRNKGAKWYIHSLHHSDLNTNIPYPVKYKDNDIVILELDQLK